MLCSLPFVVYEEKQYEIVLYGQQLILQAQKILDSVQIKTLDCIQLSSAVLSGAQLFVTSDIKLYSVAQRILSIPSQLIE
jgi:predicted nucleic acid-binding protein